MAGFLVGSAIITWVLCGALNGVIEYAAIQGLLDRTKAFIGMVVGVLLIATAMVSLALWGFPESTLAAEHLTQTEIQTVAKTSCMVNVLFAVGYCAFQLRRFWEDD
jgi:hypothetical protein